MNHGKAKLAIGEFQGIHGLVIMVPRLSRLPSRVKVSGKVDQLDEVFGTVVYMVLDAIVGIPLVSEGMEAGLSHSSEVT
jgi:hypothetical protein